MRRLILFSLLINIIFAAQKIYEVSKVTNCPGDQPILASIVAENISTTPNKIEFSAQLDVSEKVPGPLEFIFDSNKCDLSMKKCEKFTSLKAPGACDIFQGKIGMFDEALRTFQPRITCPLMPGKYIAKDSQIDLSTLSMFPSEGYVWVVAIKGVSGEAKNKKLAMCLNVEVKITKVREKKKKN